MNDLKIAMIALIAIAIMVMCNGCVTAKKKFDRDMRILPFASEAYMSSIKELCGTVNDFNPKTGKVTCKGDKDETSNKRK